MSIISIGLFCWNIFFAYFALAEVRSGNVTRGRAALAFMCWAFGGLVLGMNLFAQKAQATQNLANKQAVGFTIYDAVISGVLIMAAYLILKKPTLGK
jgi:hypothetical protein